jgi:multiple sugar transport system permease protein
MKPSETTFPSGGPGLTVQPGSARQSWRSRATDGELGGYLLLLPAVVVMVLLTIWPLIFSVGISFTNFHGGAPTTPNFIGLENYANLLGDSFFTGSIVTTATILVIAVPSQLILGYLCARIMLAAHDMIGARLFRTFFILPTMMTALSIALFWRYIMDPTIGVANFLLTSLGLPMQLFFGDANTAVLWIVFVYLWQWVPFTAMLVMAGLLGISRDIYESAALDGARWHQRIIWIDLPLLKRVLGIAGILAMVEVIRLFDLVYGATNGGPGTSTYTATLGIYRTAFQNFNTGLAAAASLLVLIVTIMIAQVFVRVAREEAK